MYVTLVPSAVGGSEEQQHQFLTSYLINDTLAIDAGSVGFYRGPDDQARIKHVLLSHSHIDHIASLPILVENAYEGKRDCVTIYASQDVLDCLRHDIFNDRLWPDFIALSLEQEPFLKLEPLESGAIVRLDNLTITAVPVNHVVPTMGFIIEDQGAAVVIVSDTGPTEAIWELANRTQNLKAVFLEASFPNAMGPLATLSKHLTPVMLGKEVQKLTRPAAIIAVHIKPRYHTQVVHELQALELPNLEIGELGKPYNF